jgi:hypothetical protein
MRKAIHALALQKVVRESDSAEPEPEPDAAAMAKPEVHSKYFADPAMNHDEQGEGCDFDPTLPTDVDESFAVCRRRAILWKAEQAKFHAEDQTGWNGMDAADQSEIDDEIIEATQAAANAWQKITNELRKKRASTLPAEDIGDIPPELDRRPPKAIRQARS